jgi:hypothetical protein
MPKKAKIPKTIKEKKKRGRPRSTHLTQKQIVNIKIGASDFKRKRGRPKKDKNSIPGMQPYNPAQAVSQTLRSGPVEKPVDNSELPPVKPPKPLLIENAKSEEVVVAPRRPSRTIKARGKGIITNSKFDHVKTAGLKAIAEELGIKVKKSWKKKDLLYAMDKHSKRNQEAHSEPIIEEVDDTPVRKAKTPKPIRPRGRPRKITAPTIAVESVNESSDGDENLPSSFVNTSRGSHSGFPISHLDLSELLLSPEHADRIREDHERHQMADEEFQGLLLRHDSNFHRPTDYNIRV